MADPKESSVLFSLKELMNLEEDRIKQEESAKQAGIQAELDAKAAAERAAIAAEEARVRAEEERRRSEEQRAREEAARLDAMKHAEVAKAQAEAENAGRIAAMQTQQEHERQLAALGQDKKKKQLTYMVGGVAALLVVAVIGGGMAISNSNKEKEAQAKAHQLAEEEAKAENDRLKREMAEYQAKMDDLQSQFAKAGTAAEKAEIEKRLKALIDNKPRPRPVGGGGARPAMPGKPCPPGDPTC